MSEMVETVWGDTAARRHATYRMLGWLDSPLLQRIYVQPQAAGSADANWLIAQVERLGIPKNGRWLSIGCGGGGLELFVVEQGICAEIEGVDIAPGAIEVAKQAAAERGINNVCFRVADLEHCRLRENSYDVVLCGMALHHIRRLEFFYEEVAQALRPGGWMLLNEFVGPSQWQWSDAQLAAINILLAALPERYRIHVLTGEVKQHQERPTIEFMNYADPSESIRSAELMPLLHKHFEVVEQRDYGGAVLGELLGYIVGNFDADRPEDVALLRLLCASEQALMATGAIQSDFTVAAARNNKRSLRRSALPFDSELERHVVRGLYPVEGTPTGRAFCWTEPDVKLVLDRPATARSLRMVVILPPVPRCLTISVDGVIVGSLRSERSDNLEPWRRIAFMLPSVTSRQPTIRLHLDQPWLPAEIWQSDDPRALGVALAAIAFV